MKSSDRCCGARSGALSVPGAGGEAELRGLYGNCIEDPRAAVGASMQSRPPEWLRHPTERCRRPGSSTRRRAKIGTIWVRANLSDEVAASSGPVLLVATKKVLRALHQDIDPNVTTRV
jgi:hypothetical protein